MLTVFDPRWTFPSSIAAMQALFEDVTRLNAEWLQPNGYIRLLPAAEFKRVPPALLRVWCISQARYTVVTSELVDWLHKHVLLRRPNSAIEIGAGMGDLGHHLGITSTDSYLQQRPDIQLYFKLQGVPVTSPPPEVECLEANEAVTKFTPGIVLASWVTRRFDVSRDVEGVSQASVYGVDEENIVSRVQTYIHIGNDGVHGQKTILSRAHEEYRFDWLLSRSIDQSTNVMRVWRRTP